MNPEACVLGIDVGTTGVRVVAVAESTEIKGESGATLAAPPQTGPGLYQDPSTWWLATRHAISTVGRQVDLKKVRALAIDGTSGTVVGVDRQGAPLTYGRMYNDKALPTTVEALARVLPEDSPAHGVTSPLARMIEMQRPELSKLLHQADWLTGQFSGRFDIADENNALKSGFDLIARQWPTWIGDTQMDPQLLPQVVPTGTDLGRIRSDVAEHFGLNPHLRIVAGTTDGCASFIASGARTLGDAVTSLGTTLALKQICDTPISLAKCGVYSHRISDVWLCGGASNSGGGVLLQFFTPERLSELEGKLMPEQPTNLGYYPLPGIGERFPHANPLLKPLLEPRPEDDARFLQGLLEGIAAIEKAGYSRLQSLGAPPIERVLTLGGGSRNESWRRIRERMLGVPVRSVSAQAAYGAALIALSSLRQQSVFAFQEGIEGPFRRS